ncbi:MULTISPECIES: caspase family protein [Trichocoleus]|uniref:Caspase family protein n=1 Tax=Trichocoleus desertorum GB2-A4 TaxID=2933944 RepID=A0ABV0J6S4_9CYAN|nr:caspase family protein [Trichocoleus sp. FACHB-46]MBD1862434.1 caspase family protein [Trichocoleus sp. FACHB-46]
MAEARFALIIANYEFQDKDNLEPLAAPAEDAKALARILENPELGEFQVKTLLNKPTRIIKQEIEAFFRARKREDLLLLYFSGHGVKDPDDGKLYFASQDTDCKFLRSTAVSAEFINSEMQRSRSKLQVLLLDCCFSGAFAKGTKTASVKTNIQDEFQGKGRVVLTATDSMNYAFEGEETDGESRCSVFTHTLVRGLETGEADLDRDGFVSTDELYNYIYERVAVEKPEQKPQKWDFGLESKILLTKVPLANVKPLIKAQKFVPDGFEILNEDFFKLRGQRQESSILKLRTATWALITQGNYIKRDQQNEALNISKQLKEFGGTSLFLIQGEPGAGKTALLKWLTYELFQNGCLVLEKKDKDQEWLKKLRSFSEQVEEQHFYVLADDVFRDESVLEELEQNPVPFPFTLLGTTRPSEDQHESLDGLGYRLNLLTIQRPSKLEKQRILSKVRQNLETKNRLDRMSSVDKNRLMNAPAMLVLMLQLTEGKPFDQIIADIVKGLPNSTSYPIYQVFGLICSFFQYGVIVPFEFIPSCLDEYHSKAVQDVIDFAETRELAGVVRTICKERFEGLGVIHELIAQKAIELNYKPRYDENPPYSARALDRYLSKIVQFLTPDNKVHKSWLCYALRLITIGNANLVRRILSDYALQMEALQQGSTISDWLVWEKMYEVIGLVDEQIRCQNQILATTPYNSSEWTYWLSLVEKFADQKQKQESISKVFAWLRINSGNRDLYNKYLVFVRKNGELDDQQEAVRQASVWLKKHPYALEVYRAYFILLKKLEKLEQIQEEITKIVVWIVDWLQEHPNDQRISKQCRLLIRDYGSSEQEKELIDRIRDQTAALFKENPDDREAFHKYLAQVKKSGTFEEKKKAIQETGSWIEIYPNDSNVRIINLSLTEEQGTREQKQKAIHETSEWLKDYPSTWQDILLKYLALIDQVGSRHHQQGAIAYIKNWLQLYPNDLAPRKHYLMLFERINVSFVELQAIVNEQWFWMSQQQKVDLDLWYVFLPILKRCNQPALIKTVTSCAIKQYPQDKKIVCYVFCYFRNYLDLETCFDLANFIFRNYKSPRTSQYKDLLSVADFFLDYDELDTAKRIYQKVLSLAKPQLNPSDDNIKFQNFLNRMVSLASIGYAHVLLKSNTPKKIADNLTHVLVSDPNNATCYWILAKSYWARGSFFYNHAIDNFRKAIDFDRRKEGFFWYEFGCFYRDALDDCIKARQCFENSLKQKTNLSACLDLAEIEIENENFSRARNLLQDGLALNLKTRLEQEKRKRLEPKIQAIQKLVQG